MRAVLFCFRRFAASFSVVAMLVMNIGIAGAQQDIDERHLASAQKAISAIHATDQFDDFLLIAARDLKDRLISSDPNLATSISEIVDKQALALAKRYADLEKEVAYVYAKHFSAEELDKITIFYSSDVGKKFLTKVPDAARDAYSAFNTWRSAIAQSLMENVKRDMSNVPDSSKSVTSVAPSSSKGPK